MQKLRRKVYENSPIFFQNFIQSYEGYLKNRNRYGDTYYTCLLELEHLQYVNEEEAKRYQALEMKKLIRYAVEKSPFYREFYKGINLAAIETIEDLKKLPVLDKDTLQKNLESFYTIPEGPGVVSHTSCKTGTPLKFRIKKEDLQKRNAFLDSFKKQHGAVNLEMKRASFKPCRIIPPKQQKKVFWRDNYSMKQRVYSSYYCTEKNAGAIAANLDKYKPDFIDGVPSAIYEMAKYINENNIFLSFKPAAIFTVAEKLYPHCRKEIEEAFGCPVRELFFSSEGMPCIMECTHDRLHYNLSSGVIETNQEGEMLATCFNTYGTPLIRYNSGDKVEMADSGKKCECGSVYPVVDYFHCNSAETLRSKSKGNVTSAHYTQVGLDFPDAFNKMQFIQNSVESIEVFIESAESYTNKVTEAIDEMLRYTFGEDMVFKIRVVEQIPDAAENNCQFAVKNRREAQLLAADS